MKSLDYSKGYQYPHDSPEGFVEENYFPEGFASPGFYNPKDQGAEKFIRERLKHLWPGRYPEKQG